MLASEIERDGCCQGEVTPPRAIRAINGSAASEEASNIHAGLCEAEIAEIEVAQVLVVSQPPLSNIRLAQFHLLACTTMFQYSPLL